MIQENKIYYIHENQIDFCKSHQTYSLDELSSVFLKTEPVKSTIKSPILKALFETREFIVKQDANLVNVYLDVGFENGSTESVKLHSRSLRDTSKDYFDILKTGIALKQDLEMYLED